ncbi:MAG: tetratricopeptide repeat protein, partial [Anaerolineae bacterium]|nr:tetratricopeptide repeat protein [Anaerolineae bacterium]
MELRGPEVRISKGKPLSLAERYLERALSFYSKDRFDDALTDIDAAIEAEPHNAELYATRGFMLVRTGHEDEAQADLDKALKINPQQWVAHYARAMMAFKKGELDEALGHLAIAKVIAPKRPEILLYQAAVYYYKKDKANAQKVIEAAAADKKLQKEIKKWQKVISELPDEKAPPMP